MNAEAFNSWTRAVRVTSNTVSANNWGDLEAPQTAGVLVFASPEPIPPGTNAPRNVGTLVMGNTISEQFYGIWSVGDFGPQNCGEHHLGHARGHSDLPRLTHIWPKALPLRLVRRPIASGRPSRDR